MQFLALFNFSALIIWLPGLLFLLLVLFSLKPDQKLKPAPGLYAVLLGLFVLSMFFAILTPRSEINKALEFARAYSPDTEINSIDDMPYDAKDAWFRMAVQDEVAAPASSGGDMFDFSDSSTSNGEQAAVAAEGSAGEIPVNQPERAGAWFLLIMFLIPGIIFFIQGPCVMERGSRLHS